MQVDDAILYGVPEAMLLNFLRHNIGEKKNNPTENLKYYKDGKFWYYNSKRKFAAFFPYWTEKQLRTLLSNLIESKILITGNFNKKAYDKTIWYTINDEVDAINSEKIALNYQESLKYLDENTLIDNNPQPEWAKTSAQMGQPIQHIINTYNQDINILANSTNVCLQPPTENELEFTEDEEKETISLPEKKITNSAMSVIEKFKNQNDENYENLRFVLFLKTNHIKNPKEFNNTFFTFEGKKYPLKNLHTTLRKFYKCLILKYHPSIGMLPETNNTTEAGMFNTLLKKVGYSMETIELIIKNWNMFKDEAFNAYGVKINSQYPNLPLLAKYAYIGTGEGFLAKTSSLTAKPKGFTTADDYLNNLD
jgi:hypothetical protein